jgi:hypothetical protein
MNTATLVSMVIGWGLTLAGLAYTVHTNSKKTVKEDSSTISFLATRIDGLRDDIADIKRNSELQSQKQYDIDKRVTRLEVFWEMNNDKRDERG